jgi:hypothetical protein
MDINEKAKQYAELDAQIKKLDTIKKPLNSEIKDYMKDNGMDVIQGQGFGVHFGTQERVTMNEAKLLDKVKSLGLTDAIKTVEVVDQSLLEDLVFNGKLNPAEIEDCVERKIVETLTVKKAKK